MTSPSASAFAGFRFPREVISVAVRWDLRYGLSYRDVEELLVGGWVDRARQVVANGVNDARLGTSLGVVHASATARREAIDVAAARLVAHAVSADESFGSLVPVESALQRLVVPLATASPVLLLVLDGMSAAVANEVVESALGLGWVEHQRTSSGGRDVLMAGLPTVTEVSRTSLLSGQLQLWRPARGAQGCPGGAGGPGRAFPPARPAGTARAGPPGRRAGRRPGHVAAGRRRRAERRR